MIMRFSILSFTLLLCGCIGGPPTEVPLPSIKATVADERQDAVVIMLPGRGDRGDVFLREGFEKAGITWGFDTIAVDAHFGYYRQRILSQRLHQDVILPAREAGYEKIWLLGVSMGGFGSLLYTVEYPDQVDGVILLAPYLGSRGSIEEIVASGGIRQWDAEASNRPDFEIAVIKWLRDPTAPVALGYGVSDGMAPAYESVLADVLPASRIYTADGGHNWTTWKPLWERIAAEIRPRQPGATQ